MLPAEILALCLDKAYPTEFPEPKMSGLGVQFRKAYKILENIDKTRHKNNAMNFMNRLFELLPTIQVILDKMPMVFHKNNCFKLQFESMYDVDPTKIYIHTRLVDTVLNLFIGIESKEDCLELPFTIDAMSRIQSFIMVHSLESSISRLYFNEFTLLLGDRGMDCYIHNRSFKEYITVGSRLPYNFYYLAPSDEFYVCYENVDKFMKYTVLRDFPIESKEQKTPKEETFLHMFYLLRSIYQNIYPLIHRSILVRPPM